ncbi:MAG: fatty acid desaturase [Cyclobacteriaceae bacterium]
MKQLEKIKDPVFKEKEFGPLDRFFLKFIRDKRDLPFIYLSLKITFTVVPMGLILYTDLLSGWQWFALAIFDLCLISLYFLGPFTLMLHNTSHRKFFKSEYYLLNNFIPWVLGPFMGQSPESYFSHHIGMHHPENNLKDDKSCTMYYQRDNILDFLTYYFRFLFIGLFELYAYLTSKNKTKMRRDLIKGEGFWYISAVLLSLINFKATLFVFILPLVIIRFGMMAGNWAQHAFIDHEDPANNFTNSITCINSVYNKRCFNDGYHIGHHFHPAMHWTDMPGNFLKNVDKYAENNAIVFEKLDYFMIWFYLMIGKYNWLANHFVNINHQHSSEEEVIALMKERTRRF